jgi:thiamine transport system permease protein
LAAVFLRAGGAASLTAADWAAVRFTLWQAALSAVLSCALAVPAARALARRRFWGRDTLVTLLGAPFILPVIVAILGLLAVFGREGLVNQALGLFGLPPFSIYGLHGILLAHVFFNLPLAVRLILHGWQVIPAERFRLAAQLGFSDRTVARVIEAPMLRQVLPGALLVIFVICLSSFAVALTLGGGPRATTVELAIYQAFRFDFDLGKAATLAALHLLYVGGIAALVLRLIGPVRADAGVGRPVARWDARGVAARVQDAVVITAVALFLALPILSLILKGGAGVVALPPSVWQAAGHSLTVALASTALCLALALPLAAARLGQVISLLGFALSPLVLGSGLFLVLQPLTNPFDWALAVTCIVNALMALPFAVRALAPAYERAEADFGRLADGLNLHGWGRWRWLILPRLRRPAGFAAGLTAALSMGDLGVIVLFADPQRATLPLQMYRLMTAYQMEAAAAAAVLLLALSLGLFWLLEKGGRLGPDT